MIDKVGKLNEETKIPQKEYINKKLTADAVLVFDAIDKDKDGKLNQSETAEFGFSTNDYNNLDENDFVKKYIEYREKVSTLNGATAGFENLLFNNETDKLLYPVNLTTEQRKELVKRMELYGAVQKVLSDDITLHGIIKQYNELCKAVKAGKEINNLNLGYILFQTTLNRNIQDGKIGPYRQGKLGDCWFLSQLNSYASTPKGAKNISDRIRDNQNGTYTVTFQNPFNIEEQEEYTVSITDLWLQSEKQSLGDLDVQILEQATNKMLNRYIEDEAKIPQEETIESGTIYKTALVHKAFGYKDEPVVYDTTDEHEPLEDMRYSWESYDGKYDCRHLMTFAKHKKFTDIIEKNQYKSENLLFSKKKLKEDDDTNEKSITPSKHQYNILTNSNQKIFIQNPHFSDTPLSMSNEKFDEFCDILYYLPTENLVEYSPDKQAKKHEEPNIFMGILNSSANFIYGNIKLGATWIYKTAVNAF